MSTADLPDDVIFDEPQIRPWQGRLAISAHLTCRDLDRLHDFAAALGFLPSYFQREKNGRHPHYDLIGQKAIARARRLGAKQVDARTVLAVMEHAQ